MPRAVALFFGENFIDSEKSNENWCSLKLPRFQGFRWSPFFPLVR